MSGNTFTYSILFEYYRNKSEQDVSKLVDNLYSLSALAKHQYIKLAVDDIGRAKLALSRAMRTKCKPLDKEEYIAIMAALTQFQIELVTQNYSKNNLGHTKRELTYVAYALDSMRLDVLNMSSFGKKPSWYTNISPQTLKNKEIKLKKLYSKFFKGSSVPFVMA